MKVYVIFVNEYPTERDYPKDIHRITTNMQSAIDFVDKMNKERQMFYDAEYSWAEHEVKED